MMTWELAEAIAKARVNLSVEKTTQAELYEHLQRQFPELSFEREVRLGPGEVVDIMLGGIAIEVKLRGARKIEVFHQLERYAAHGRVTGLILATNLSMGLPPLINGKPVFFVSLGRAWL